MAHEVRSKLNDSEFKSLQQALKASNMTQNDYIAQAIREKILLDSLMESGANEEQ